MWSCIHPCCTTPHPRCASTTTIAVIVFIVTSTLHHTLYRNDGSRKSLTSALPKFASHHLLNESCPDVVVVVMASAADRVAVAAATLAGCVYASHPACLASAPIVPGGMGSSVATQASSSARRAVTTDGWSAANELAYC